MESVDRSKIAGWGADRKPETRPGVPMEKPLAVTPATPVPRQLTTTPPMKAVSVAEMPPVFGTTIPPRGVSGVMRRAAYQIPDHKPSHWLLLMLADRVDVFEGHLEDLAQPKVLAIGGGVLGLGILGWLLSRRR